MIRWAQAYPLKTLSDRKIHRQWHRLLPPKLKKGQKRSKDAGKKRGRIDSQLDGCTTRN